MKPAAVWNDRELAWGTEILGLALHGVGDGRWERLFRMCATLCLHRGLHEEEIEHLPTGGALSRNLAGGPVVVYYSRGVPEGVVSCDPCHDPGQRVLSRPGARWPISLPVDCGQCPPCRQRATIEADPEAFVRQVAEGSTTF
jgi:hypothetical protein